MMMTLFVRERDECLKLANSLKTLKKLKSREALKFVHIQRACSSDAVLRIDNHYIALDVSTIFLLSHSKISVRAGKSKSPRIPTVKEMINTGSEVRKFNKSIYLQSVVKVDSSVFSCPCRAVF